MLAFSLKLWFSSKKNEIRPILIYFRIQHIKRKIQSLMKRSPYRRAKRRVNVKKGFYYHFSIYAIIISFLAFINMWDWSGEIWFVFPMAGWGMAIAIHYVAVFGIPGSRVLTKEWEEREMEKEIRKFEYLDQKERESKGIPEEYERLELEEELELKDFKKLRKDWDESDFV